MRSWQRALANTADALVVARACGQDGVDLDVALTARAVVLEHVLTVLDDIATRPRARPVTIGEAVPVAVIEADPLDGLARVLRGRTRLAPTRAPSELLDAGQANDPVTTAWVEVARRAFDADSLWTHRAAPSLPAEQAWRAVAEIATLAHAIAVLDRDLAARRPTARMSWPSCNPRRDFSLPRGRRSPSRRTHLKRTTLPLLCPCGTQRPSSKRWKAVGAANRPWHGTHADSRTCTTEQLN